MLTFLIVAGLVVAWVLRCLLVPYASCMWCGGSGKNPLSGPRRHGDCWFCHGARRRRVLGAKVVHQLWLAWKVRK